MEWIPNQPVKCAVSYLGGSSLYSDLLHTSHKHELLFVKLKHACKNHATYMKPLAKKHHYLAKYKGSWTFARAVLVIRAQVFLFVVCRIPPLAEPDSGKRKKP